MRTVQEIQADITALKAAKIAVLSGKQVKSLTIGSDNMQRRYSYQQIDLKMLKYELANLEAELADAEGKAGTTDGIGFKSPRHHIIYVNAGWR